VLNAGRTQVLRPTPIFDTNIFGHVQEGSIPKSDWQRLLRHRPGHGWPLSCVTALELLAGLHDVPSRKFPQLKEQFDLAFKLSNGRILEEPRFLFCTEVLRIPFPDDFIPPSASVIACYIDVVRRAKTLAEILAGRVPYKGGRAGFQTTSVLNDLVTGPKNQWVEGVEAIATRNFPRWRELYQQTGKRLPPEMRKELEPRSAWEAQRCAFAQSILAWLGASTKPECVAETTERLDAVLEFTIFVAREFLVGNYSLEKHWSDVYDQFQLHYLAIDRFIIVSEDSDLSKRTSRSRQASRIMPFQEFLQTF
jgi:hypothetical protein